VQAKFHYLVMPTESIPNLKALNKQHIPLLRHMKDKGLQVAKDRYAKLAIATSAK
jgi:hypothetical protein